MLTRGIFLVSNVASTCGIGLAGNGTVSLLHMLLCFDLMSSEKLQDAVEEIKESSNV